VFSKEGRREREGEREQKERGASLKQTILVIYKILEKTFVL
jgi:hypothetical protein